MRCHEGGWLISADREGASAASGLENICADLIGDHNRGSVLIRPKYYSLITKKQWLVCSGLVRLGGVNMLSLFHISWKNFCCWLWPMIYKLWNVQWYTCEYWALHQFLSFWICYRYKKNCFELKCFVCSCKIRWTWSTICYTVQSNRWPIQLQSRVGNVAIQECRQQAIMVISRSCLTCIALVQIVFRSMFIWQRLNFKKM